MDGPWPGTSVGESALFLFGDTKVLLHTILYRDSDPAKEFAVPLYDIATGEVVDLGQALGMAPGTRCRISLVAPNRQVACLACGPLYEQQDKGHQYLINLQTFALTPIPAGEARPVGWSANSQALLQARYEPGVMDVIMADVLLNTGEVFGLSEARVRGPAWSPSGATLAFLSEDGLSANLLDATTRRTRQQELPQASRAVLWSPNGEALALEGTDGSVWYWRIESGSPRRISPAMPEVRQLRWTPEGKGVSFVAGPDLYIYTLDELNAVD